jgi:FlaG/FlaF family flagellin (archaellin)
LEFESQLRSGGGIFDWSKWDGFRPEFNQFDKNVKIQETEDTIKAEVDDKNVDPEKKGVLEEFVSWFKSGIEKIAKELGKALEFAMASIVAMSVEQAMSQVFQTLKFDQPQGSGKSELPPESQKALADAAAKGPKHLAEAVKTLVAQNPSSAPAIAAAAMKEAAKANTAISGDAAAQIVEAAVQANPQAAPQIAGAVAQAATESLPPEKAAQVLPGITKAASEAAPSQAGAVAGEVAKVAVENLPTEMAPKVLGEITKAAVEANPQAAAQISKEVAEVATNELSAVSLPNALGQIAQNAAEAAPEETSKIADALSDVAIKNIPSEVLPGALAQIVQGLATANPEAAPDTSKAVVANVISSLPPELAAQIIPAIAQTSASPDSVAEVVTGIMEAMSDQLSSNELAKILPALANLVAETSPEDLAAVIANMLSKISTLPQPLATDLENALKGIESTSPDSGKPAPAPPAQVGSVADSKQNTDKAGESAAADFAANFQGAPVQTEFNAGKVDAPLEQKAIPDNVLKLIAETVSKIQIGETQTTITLQKTPDLPGNTTLEVRMENGRLEVVINATDPQAAQLLQNNIAALQSALSAGSGASQVSVSVEGPGTSVDSNTESNGVGERSDKPQTSSSGDKKKVEANRGSGGAQ